MKKSVVFGVTFFLLASYGVALAQSGQEGEARVDDALGEARAYYELAELYMNRGDYNRAIKLYNRAISVDPGYAQAYHDLGAVYLIKGNYDRAIGYFSNAVYLRPNNAKAYFDLGNAYYAKGDRDKALELYEECLLLVKDKKLKKQIKKKIKKIKKK